MKKLVLMFVAIAAISFASLLLIPLLLTQLLLSNQKARIEKKERNDRWASGLAVLFLYLLPKPTDT